VDQWIFSGTLPSTTSTFPPSFGSESVALMRDTWVLKPVVAPQPLWNTTALSFPDGEAVLPVISFSQPWSQPLSNAAIERAENLRRTYFMRPNDAVEKPHSEHSAQRGAEFFRTRRTASFLALHRKSVPKPHSLGSFQHSKNNAALAPISRNHWLLYSFTFASITFANSYIIFCVSAISSLLMPLASWRS